MFQSKQLSRKIWQKYLHCKNVRCESKIKLWVVVSLNKNCSIINTTFTLHLQVLKLKCALFTAPVICRGKGNLIFEINLKRILTLSGNKSNRLKNTKRYFFNDFCSIFQNKSLISLQIFPSSTQLVKIYLLLQTSKITSLFFERWDYFLIVAIDCWMSIQTWVDFIDL